MFLVGGFGIVILNNTKKSQRFLLALTTIGLSAFMSTVILYPLTLGTFILEPLVISSNIAKMPVPSASFLVFLQGILIFTSILFGFYSIVLVEVLRTVLSRVRAMYTNINDIFSVRTVFFTIVIILLIEPIYIFTISVSASLLAISYHGQLAQLLPDVSLVNITPSNKTINSLYSNTILQAQSATKLAFTGGGLVLFDILVYVALLIGLVEAYQKLGDRKRKSNLGTPPRIEESKDAHERST